MGEPCHKSELAQVSQAQQERLSHIDFRAYFLGAVGRHDLVSRFGIKEAAATRDLALYRNLAPRNLDYDTRARSYTLTSDFHPLFGYSPAQVLSALAHGFGEDFVGRDRALLRCELPTELNKPLLPILAVLTRAIRQDKVVKIRYHSLSSGETRREIVPFALVDNGLRWHVRAYDRLKEGFRDFVITRIASAKPLDMPGTEHERREADIQWNRIVELEIVPHPGNIVRKQAIEMDYAMEDGVLRVKVRAASAGYLLRRWNVDCTEDHSLKGPEYHLWLRNRQALYGVDNLVIAPGYQN